MFNFYKSLAWSHVFTRAIFKWIQVKLPFVMIVIFLASLIIPATRNVLADTNPQSLPFSQNWSNTGLITTDDNWTGVPGIVGYRGDALTSSTGTDPQTILADGTTTPV